MRHNARVDRNQPEIVRQLRKLGCSVLVVSNLKNCFDILVGYNYRNYAFEIKDNELPESRKNLTPGEQKFFDIWKGQVHKIETIDEALDILGIKI